MTREEELVKSAQEYDLAHRPWGYWRRVPDEQVLRLLAGAKLAESGPSEVAS